MRRVSFSNENIDITFYALHHDDTDAALRDYFSRGTNFHVARFIGYQPSELAAELETRLNELDMASSLAILSAIEAVLRIDYLQRCYRKERDTLSRAFRELHKRKKYRARLEDDILNLWRQHTDGAAQLISELKGAFKYRHWLAHGRYWQPKLGKKYDFISLYTLATNVLTNFPLVRV